MTPKESLAHAIRIRFGLPNNEPNAIQLLLIQNDIIKIANKGRIPTDGDWKEIVADHCPSSVMHKFGGEDNSDLNTLLLLALQSTMR